MNAGTDRVELTEDEREALETWERDGIYACPHPDSCPTPRACRNEFGLFAVVESIVAARTVDLRRWKCEAIEVIYGLQELGKALDLPLGERITGPKAVEAVQALTDERDELRKVIEGEPWLADLVAARAELAAANTEVARMKDIYRVHELGRLEAEAERDAYRAQRDEAREQRDIWAGKARVNGDDYEAAEATLDRVTAVLDEYCTAGCCQHAESNEKQLHDLLRAALTPEGTE